MLKVSHPNFLFNFLGWDYPIGLFLDASTNTTNYSNHDNNHHDYHHHSANPNQHYSLDDRDHNHDGDHDRDRDRKSPPSTRSGDHNSNESGATLVVKRLNHNASERDRRNKINGLYKNLRALFPAADQMKQLSIPSTVARVLKYIPELQKEIEDLIHKKEDMLSKITLLQGGRGKFSQEEKPRKQGIIKEEKSFSSVNISINKLGEREIVVQLSTYERIPLPEVLQFLERNGLLVIDVSSSQSFGGRAFYNIHLWMEGNKTMRYEMLNEELITLIEQHKQVYFKF